MSTLRSQLVAIEGFVELRMFEEAWSQFSKLDESVQNFPDMRPWRIYILNGLGRFSEALSFGKQAIAADPRNPALYVGTAFAARSMLEFQEARSILLAGQEFLTGRVELPFNLAIIACQLGELDEARTQLLRAFAIDPECRITARQCIELEPLHSFAADDAHKLEPLDEQAPSRVLPPK